MAATSPAFHDAAKRGFGTSVIAAYEKGRPEHEERFVRTLLQSVLSDATTNEGKYPALPLLEVGSGTGKYTRVLYKVLSEQCLNGTDPNLICADPADMTDKLHEDLPDLVFHKLPAHDLAPISGASVGTIIIAQAFHWFANEASVAELMRVLKPGGYWCAVWNMRDDGGAGSNAPWMQRFEALLTRHYDPGTPRQITYAWKEVLAIPELGPLQSVRLRVEGGYEGDEERIISYVLSISDVSKRSSAEQEAIVEEFRQLLHSPDVPFTLRPSDGAKVWHIPMFTEMYWAQRL